MEMRVDAKRIRLEREKRAWSQQHLASVTELGLRTIQRIEATGLASYESIQAIASAYGMIVSDLVVVTDTRRTDEPGWPVPRSVPSPPAIRRDESRRFPKLPPAVLATGIIAATLVATLVSDSLWWVGPLVMAVAMVGARALHNFLGALGRSGLGRATGLAAAVFAGTAIVAYADPNWVAMMMPILAGGSIGSLGLTSTCAWHEPGSISGA